MTVAPVCAPLVARLSTESESVVPDGLLRALAQVPDPRDPRGVRYRLATLLAIGVCAMTSASRPKVPVLAAYPHADHRP